MIYRLHIAWISFKSTYGFLDWQTFLFIKIVNPFFEMLFFVYLAIFTNADARLAEVVIGNAMLLCSFGCLGDLGMLYVRERYHGTLKVLLASSKHHMLVYSGKAFFHIVDAFLTTLFGLCIGYFVFHIPLFELPLLSIMVVILVSVFACVSLGFLLGSFCILINDINLIYNCLAMGMRFLCGAMIEVALLPSVLQSIAYCLPVTHGIQAIHLLINGHSLQGVSPLLLQEFLLGAIYFVVSFLVFEIIEKQAKKKATIDLM